MLFRSVKLPLTDEHVGFAIYKKRAIPLVSAIIQKVDCHEVWITGHSLGGAIAVAVAPWIRDKLKVKVRVSTAGSPRYAGVLWRLFIYRGIPHRRWVVSGDIVPHLAPCILGWIHCGKPVFISRPDIVPTGNNPFAKHFSSAYQGHVDFEL